MSLNQNINTVQDYEDVLAAIQGYVNKKKTYPFGEPHHCYEVTVL